MPKRTRIPKPRKSRRRWDRDPSEQMFGDSRRKREHDKQVEELKQELDEALAHLDEELHG